MDASAARKDLVTFGRRLYEKGFVASTDGNLSARLPEGGFLTTPTGLPKGELSEALIASLDAEGRPVAGKPSSEWPMHMAIYRARPDVGAVVHAHPPFATALACAGRGIDRPVLSEVVISLGHRTPRALRATLHAGSGRGRGGGARRTRRGPPRQPRGRHAWGPTCGPPTTGWRPSSRPRASPSTPTCWAAVIRSPNPPFRRSRPR